MKKILNEFIGSFFWTSTMVICLLGSAGQFTALAVGGIVMALVFAGGHISGAHYNPATTIAVWLRGKCNVRDVPLYIFAQLLSAAVAALIADSILLHKLGDAQFPKGDAIAIIFAELLGTFALVYTLLNVATTKDTSGNSFYGLAVGGIVMAGIFSLGNITGGAFNPAVALGLSISKIVPFSSIWLYWIGELIGGVSAAYAFIFINGKE